jgi:hypothetical protein
MHNCLPAAHRVHLRPTLTDVTVLSRPGKQPLIVGCPPYLPFCTVGVALQIQQHKGRARSGCHRAPRPLQWTRPPPVPPAAPHCATPVNGPRVAGGTGTPCPRRLQHMPLVRKMWAALPCALAACGSGSGETNEACCRWQSPEASAVCPCHSNLVGHQQHKSAASPLAPASQRWHEAVA